MTIDDMLGRGELERVEPDSQSAAESVEEARRHLESARAISGTDPNGAYQLAYDAARKAVVAAMRASGLRVRRGEGGHALTAAYAGAAIDGELGRRLEAMRRRRNRSEYGTAFFGAAEVAEAIETAAALHSAVRGE